MNAVETVKQMRDGGIRWHLENGAVKLKAGRGVSPDLEAAIKQNKQAILKLVRNNPTDRQLAMLSEMEAINQQWRGILEQECQGFPGDVNLNAVEAQCSGLSIRAVEIWETLTIESPALLESTYFLEPDHAEGFA